jgi:hypothetical protein
MVHSNLAYCINVYGCAKNSAQKPLTSDVPSHRNELNKRMTIISFATAWNTVNDRKYNPWQKIFLKELKIDLLFKD